MNRQADESLIQRVTHGKIPNAEAHVSTDRMVMDRHVMDLNADPSLPKRAEDFGTILNGYRKQVVPVTPANGRARRQSDGEVGELTAVGKRDFVSALDELVNPPELASAKRSLNISHPVVESDLGNVVEPFALLWAPNDAMRPESTEPSGEFIIVRRH